MGKLALTLSWRLAFAIMTIATQPAWSASSESQRAFAEAERMLGTVPTILKLVPDVAVEGTWAEYRDILLSQRTDLAPKYKDLIALAVSARVPCEACVHLHRRSAIEISRATEVETKEAIAIAAGAGHWMTIIGGLQANKAALKRDFDRILKHTRASGGARSLRAGTATVAVSPEKVYEDIRRTWGFVPSFMSKFPRNGVAAAWQALKGLELSRETVISAKHKALIGYAVASQSTCHECLNFAKAIAKKAGAKEIEMNETIAIAAITSYWGTVLNGHPNELQEFKSNADRIIAHVKSSTSTGSSSSTTEN